MCVCVCETNCDFLECAFIQPIYIHVHILADVNGGRGVERAIELLVVHERWGVAYPDYSYLLKPSL